MVCTKCYEDLPTSMQVWNLHDGWMQWVCADVVQLSATGEGNERREAREEA